ncbi:hypothetical protein [Methylobacterium sp. CM6247]
MRRLGRISLCLDMVRPAPTGPRTGPADGEGRLSFRHKLMLALALEILVLGFRQSEIVRQDKGVVVETPSHPGNAIV